jgi:hypothetical protein
MKKQITFIARIKRRKNKVKFFRKHNGKTEEKMMCGMQRDNKLPFGIYLYKFEGAGIPIVKPATNKRPTEGRLSGGLPHQCRATTKKDRYTIM